MIRPVDFRCPAGHVVECFLGTDEHAPDRPCPTCGAAPSEAWERVDAVVSFIAREAEFSAVRERHRGAPGYRVRSGTTAYFGGHFTDRRALPELPPLRRSVAEYVGTYMPPESMRRDRVRALARQAAGTFFQGKRP